MQTLFKNTASQKVAVWAKDKVTEEGKTGDADNITAEISIDGAASAATNDANPTELDATDHPGIYLFDLTQAETNGNLIIITPVSSTANIVFEPRSIIIYTNEVPTILADTNELQTDLANGGRLDLLIDAIKERTDNLPDDPADDSDIDTQLAAIAGYLDTEIAAILEDTATTIPGLIAALNDITVANVLAGVIEGTTTLKQAMQACLAFCAGKASGGGTATLLFRDQADSKNRLSMTVDEDGNRSAVTPSYD